ncbi:hypothetical protein PGQ11_014529 [Apiospora arundinis]|uniref:Ecp2 effector protein-like domain-containing protein n=1 Tax=Apiospora arundinis TaxID=335852 RepID=A0ABR2HSI2_9PEZI
MLISLIISLFFCLLSLAASTKPGFVEYNFTRSDGTISTVYLHESFVPYDKVAAAPLAKESVAPPAEEVSTTPAVSDTDERFIIFWNSSPGIGPLCSLGTRSCTTTAQSAVWDDCLTLMAGFDSTPGYWDVSFFQQRNLYGILGFHAECIVSLARDDANINDGTQISTVDVTGRMRNAGRSCGVVSDGNIIRVGAKVSLNCPNTGAAGGTALLRLWIHSTAGVDLPKREEGAAQSTDKGVAEPSALVALPQRQTTNQSADIAEPLGLATENVSAVSEAVEPVDVLTVIFTPQQVAAPKCSQGTMRCMTTETSPVYEDCNEIIQAFANRPGFWNVSSWADQGVFSILAHQRTCSVQLARRDLSQEEAQISTYDVISRINTAWMSCSKQYGEDPVTQRLEAVFADYCPNIPKGRAPISVWVGP